MVEGSAKPPRTRRESSATRRKRAASRKPKPPRRGWVSRVGLCEFLARVGRGRFHPSTIASWERETRPSFAHCWQTGGGQGRPNWYDPWAVSRWLYDRERTYSPGRALRVQGQELYAHPLYGRRQTRDRPYWAAHARRQTTPARRSGGRAV